ncbi:MAG: TonB-dependent receptor domain-containing protein [Arenicella sp.]
MTAFYQEKKLKQTLLLSSITAVFSNQVAFSAELQQSNNVVALDMISVVGQATSGLDHVVNSDDLEKNQASDLSDIFRRESSVSVGGSVKMGQKVYVRNIGEDSLNVSVDGAEQAGAVFHHSGRIAVDPELLKRVEIEAGAGSAAAGPGALGGSVRFTTKDPEDLLKEGQNIGALVKTSYFSNGDNKKASATVFGRSNTGVLSGMLSLVGSDVDNSDDGNGDEIAGTESEKSLGYAKVIAELSDEQSLSLSYENVTEEGKILYKPELIASRRNVPEPTEGNRVTSIVNYALAGQDNDWLDLSLNLYHTEQEQEREFRGTSYDGAVETVGLTLQNKSRIAQHQLVYGINYRDDESRLHDVDFAQPDFQEAGKVKGIYLQDVIEFNQQLTVSTGIRFDDYELNDVNAQNITDSGFSPNLSANYELMPGLSISAGYAEALRGPEVKDSFKLSTSSNIPDLQAEKAKNIELGLDFSRSDFNLGLGVYRSVIENPIAGVTPFAKVYENLEDDIKSLGYFVRLDHSWDKLTLAASFNSADTEANGEPVTRYFYSSSAASTGDTLILDLGYQFSENLTAGWATEFVKGIDDIRLVVAGEQLQVDKPGYSVHDIYLRWLPLSDDNVTVNFAVKNLFDKQYLSHGSVEDFQGNAGYEGISGSPEAGRDVRLSVAVRF